MNYIKNELITFLSWVEDHSNLEVENYENTVNEYINEKTGTTNINECLIHSLDMTGKCFKCNKQIIINWNAEHKCAFCDDTKNRVEEREICEICRKKLGE